MYDPAVIGMVQVHFDMERAWCCETGCDRIRIIPVTFRTKSEMLLRIHVNLKE
jgi:hypothetical protein